MLDLLAPTAQRLRARLRGNVLIELLPYPASGLLLSLEYPAFARFGHSPLVGVRLLTARLEQLGFAADFDRPVVLIGFSQGALVITETLAMPEDRRFAPGVAPLSPNARRRVWAAVSVGNPSFRAGEPFNDGTPSPGVSGMLARPFGALDSAGDVLVDLAESDDVAAQHVRTSTMDGHLAYGRRGYPDRVVDWVMAKLDERTRLDAASAG